MTDATASLTISLVMVGRELDALVPLLVEGMTGEKADVEAPLLVDGPAKKVNYISLKIQYSQAFMASLHGKKEFLHPLTHNVVVVFVHITSS